MSKEEKQLQQPKEELTAEQLKGVDGAEGITMEQEQLDAEEEAGSANAAMMGF
ncbi:hypothetical protein [Synechococcus sp. UW179A]|uniref:hypothetical protein n=1 Tax=Synechococcus sp. UW179A TaxID=2575510 RepID=UPI0014820716|nr:hypothetical protein [Synechococcus sp. UW179A]